MDRKDKAQLRGIGSGRGGEASRACPGDASRAICGVRRIVRLEDEEIGLAGSEAEKVMGETLDSLDSEVFFVLPSGLPAIHSAPANRDVGITTPRGGNLTHQLGTTGCNVGGRRRANGGSSWRYADDQRIDNGIGGSLGRHSDRVDTSPGRGAADNSRSGIAGQARGQVIGSEEGIGHVGGNEKTKGNPYYSIGGRGTGDALGGKGRGRQVPDRQRR